MTESKEKPEQEDAEKKQNDKDLFLACVQNRPIAAVKLLNQGANPNKARDQDRRTCLHHASEKNLSELTSVLLDKGADYSAKDKYGLTPLGWSSRQGHLVITKLLINAGSDPNIRDNNHRTPLHRAVDKGHLEVASFLLENGADVNVQDESGQSCLHLALLKNHLSIATLLVEKYKIDTNLKDKHSRTSLHYASDKGYTDFIVILLKHDSDPNARDKGGRVALHWAVRAGNEKLVEVLLSYNADPNERTENGRTPLHHASDLGYTNIAKRLLDKGCDPTIADSDRRTALHYASGIGDIEIATLLLENPEMKLNAKDKSDETPIFHATRNNQVKMVKFLVSEGADINIKDKSQRQCFHIACEKGFNDLAIFLFKQQLPQLPRMKAIQMPKLQGFGITGFLPSFCEAIQTNKQEQLTLDTTSTPLTYNNVLLLVQALRKREKNFPKKCCNTVSTAKVDFLVQSQDFQTQKLALSVTGTSGITKEQEKKTDPLWLLIFGTFLCLVLWPMFAIVSTFDNWIRKNKEAEAPFDSFASLTLRNLDKNDPPRYQFWAEMYESPFGYLFLRFFSFFLLLPIIFFPFLISSLVLSPNSSDEVVNSVILGFYLLLVCSATLYLPRVIFRDSRFNTLDLPQPIITRFTFHNLLSIFTVVFDLLIVIGLGIGPLKLYHNSLYLEEFFTYLYLRIPLTDGMMWFNIKFGIFVFFALLWVIMASHLFYLSFSKQPWLLSRIPFVGLFVTLFTHVFYLFISLNLLSFIDCSYSNLTFDHEIFGGVVCWGDDHKIKSAFIIFIFAIFTWSSSWIGPFFSENYASTQEVHYIEAHMTLERSIKTCLACSSLLLTNYPAVGFGVIMVLEILLMYFTIKNKPSDNATINQFKLLGIAMALWTNVCNLIAKYAYDNPLEQWLPFILLMIGYGILLLIFVVVFALGVYWSYPAWGQRPDLFGKSKKYQGSPMELPLSKIPTKKAKTKKKPKEDVLPGEVVKTCGKSGCKETVVVFCEECGSFFCCDHDNTTHSKGDMVNHFRPNILGNKIDDVQKDIDLVFDSDDDDMFESKG